MGRQSDRGGGAVAAEVRNAYRGGGGKRGLPLDLQYFRSCQSGLDPHSRRLIATMQVIRQAKEMGLRWVDHDAVSPSSTSTRHRGISGGGSTARRSSLGIDLHGLVRESLVHWDDEVRVTALEAMCTPQRSSSAVPQASPVSPVDDSGGAQGKSRGRRKAGQKGQAGKKSRKGNKGRLGKGKSAAAKQEVSMMPSPLELECGLESIAPGNLQWIDKASSDHKRRFVRALGQLLERVSRAVSPSPSAQSSARTSLSSSLSPSTAADVAPEAIEAAQKSRALLYQVRSFMGRVQGALFRLVTSFFSSSSSSSSSCLEMSLEVLLALLRLTSESLEPRRVATLIEAAMDAQSTGRVQHLVGEILTSPTVQVQGAWPGMDTRLALRGLVQRALSAAGSAFPRESAGGAHMLRLIFRRYVRDMGWRVDLREARVVEENEDDETRGQGRREGSRGVHSGGVERGFPRWCSGQQDVEQDAEVSSIADPPSVVSPAAASVFFLRQLMGVAARTRAHGLFLALRYVVEDGGIVQDGVGRKDEGEWRGVVSALANLTTTGLVQSPLFRGDDVGGGNEVEENEEEDQDRGGDSPSLHSAALHSTAHNLLVLKECSLLAGNLVKYAPSSVDSILVPNSTLSAAEAVGIGDALMARLLGVKHMGAVTAAGDAFSMVCERFLRLPLSTSGGGASPLQGGCNLRDQPRLWMVELLQQAEEGEDEEETVEGREEGNEDFDNSGKDDEQAAQADLGNAAACTSDGGRNAGARVLRRSREGGVVRGPRRGWRERSMGVASSFLSILRAERRTPAAPGARPPLLHTACAGLMRLINGSEHAEDKEGGSKTKYDDTHAHVAGVGVGVGRVAVHVRGTSLAHKRTHRIHALNVGPQLTF